MMKNSSCPSSPTASSPRIHQAERGSATRYSSLVIPFLMGLLGVMLEYGYAYMQQRDLQMIADISAYMSASNEAIRTSDQREDLIRARVVAMGYGTRGLEINVQDTQRADPATGQSRIGVRVLLQRPGKRFLGGFWQENGRKLNAQAEALVAEKGAVKLVEASSESVRRPLLP